MNNGITFAKQFGPRLGIELMAQRVVADVGGDLKIESLQDRSQYQEKQSSQGLSVSIPVTGTGKFGASVSASQANIRSNYQSAAAQSGIQAGDGGFSVDVQGNTSLIGGAITSTQKALDLQQNHFATKGALTLHDLENKAQYSANSVGGNLGMGSQKGGSAGIGQDSGNAKSLTTAGISGIAGDAAKRTGDAQQGIAPIFDKDAVRADVQAQVQITQMFGSQAGKAVGDYAQQQQEKAAALKAQAANLADNDPDKTRLQQEAQKLDSQWGDQGSMRLTLHSLTGGLTGGLGGALGAAASTLSAPALMQAMHSAGVEGPLVDNLTALASTLTGAAVGGAAGAGSALNEAANNTLYHYRGEIIAADTLQNNKIVELAKKDLLLLVATEAKEGKLGLMMQKLDGDEPHRVSAKRLEDSVSNASSVYDLSKGPDFNHVKGKTDMAYVTKPGTNPRIWFANGVDNTTQQAWDSAQKIAAITQQDVGLIHNGTQGTAADIGEYLPESFTMKDALNEYTYRSINSQGPSLVVLHSAGNEDYYKAMRLGALQGYSYPHISVVSLGSPVGSNKLGKAIDSVQSKMIGQVNSLKDPVTYSKTYVGAALIAGFSGGVYGCSVGPLGCISGAVAGSASVMVPGLYGIKSYHPVDSYLKRSDVVRLLNQATKK